MNKQMTEVYAYYKEMYPKMAILFRIHDNFVSYLDDAERIGDALQISVNDPPKITLPADQILKYTDELCKKGILIKTVSWRNSDGDFALPDIKRLQREQNMDY